LKHRTNGGQTALDLAKAAAAVKGAKAKEERTKADEPTKEKAPAAVVGEKVAVAVTAAEKKRF
jgi:hypothetical protein